MSQRVFAGREPVDRQDDAFVILNRETTCPTADTSHTVADEIASSGSPRLCSSRSRLIESPAGGRQPDTAGQLLAVLARSRRRVRVGRVWRAPCFRESPHEAGTDDRRRLRALASCGRASTAVFLLAGGPGSSGASLAGAAEGWARPLHSTMDIVVVDQRGTWHSNALHCAQETETRPASSFGHIFDEGWVRQCRALLERTADLAQYTTDAAAADLDDVRAALGYEQISVYGGSYGTRLAQAYMRRFPKRTRSVVLDGTMPLDYKGPLTYAASAQQALDRVFEQCAASATCRRAHPDLRADFARLLDRFRAGPIATSVTRPGQAPVPVKMSLGDFGYAVRGILYVSGLIDDLPNWIGRAAKTGDVSVFAQRYWERQRTFSRTFATGLHFSVLCAEDVAFIGDPEIAGATAGTFLGRYVIDEYRRACALWPKGNWRRTSGNRLRSPCRHSSCRGRSIRSPHRHSQSKSRERCPRRGSSCPDKERTGRSRAVR